jgi:glycosyltransferase involved in cell wall biosynthesis
MMRVLHLTHELTSHPGSSGGASRQYFLLKQLVARGDEVRSVTPALADRLEASNAAEVCAEAGIELITVPRDENRLREAIRAVVKDPSVALDLFRAPWWSWRGSVFWPSIKSVAIRLRRDWNPDVILIEHDHLAHWGARLPRGVPLVLASHNASWEYYASRAKSSPSFWMRVLMRAENRRFLHHVRKNLLAFEAIVATSPDDAALFEKVATADTFVVPNGADCAGISTNEFEPSHHVVFIGTLNYAPNVEGVVWFCERVWPELRKRVPGATFDIVGRAPSESVLALDKLPGVTVVGPVESVLPYLNKAAVLVAPLLSGGGTKLKVVEAFAAERPMVATSSAITGIAAVDGEHFLLADDPISFAAAIDSLFTNPVLARRLAKSSRELALSKYDWPRQGDLLHDALVQIVDDRSRQVNRQHEPKSSE